LVVPGVYGYASATKWLTDIELTTFAAKKQYWVPGTHQVLCRATDTSGHTQTRDRVSPVPNGATGWHTIVFTTT
jgi:DMSO/TMAO reductase YedYZ molybdopterin-dependent catalytic subunit